MSANVRRYLAAAATRATALQKPYIGRQGSGWAVYVPACHRFGFLWWGQMPAETFPEALVRLDGLLLSHGYDLTTCMEKGRPFE